MLTFLGLLDKNNKLHVNKPEDNIDFKPIIWMLARKEDFVPIIKLILQIPYHAWLFTDIAKYKYPSDFK